METWTHRNMTWRHGHGDIDMGTWTRRYGHGDTAWRRGYGDMNTETWTWTRTQEELCCYYSKKLFYKKLTKIGQRSPGLLYLLELYGLDPHIATRREWPRVVVVTGT